MSRLWVDANIILRFVTKEPPKMAARAAQLMVQAEAGEVSLYIAPLVLAEIVWVLRSFYQYTMAEIAEVMIIALAGCKVVQVTARIDTVIQGGREFWYGFVLPLS